MVAVDGSETSKRAFVATSKLMDPSKGDRLVVVTVPSLQPVYQTLLAINSPEIPIPSPLAETAKTEIDIVKQRWAKVQDDLQKEAPEVKVGTGLSLL